MTFAVCSESVMKCINMSMSYFVMLTGVLLIAANQSTDDVGMYKLTFQRLINDTKSFKFAWKQISNSSSFQITKHNSFIVPTDGILKAELSLTTGTYRGKLMTAACITLKRTNQKTCQRMSGKVGSKHNFFSQLVLDELYKVQKNDQLEVYISRWKKYIYKVAEYNRLRLYYI